jgi:hypothetical protein
MPDVRLPDGTILRFPEGMSREDMAAATRKYLDQKAAPTQEPEGFRLGGLRENLIGEGAVDTPGEVVGDIIGTGAAGVARGVRSLAELPEMAGRGLTWLGQAARGVDRDDRISVLDTRTGAAVDRGYDWLAQNDPINPAAAGYVDQRQGQTTAAEYAGTVGEFIGGAAGARGRAALTAAVGGGVGSEAAGQRFEGERFEPVARIVGGVAGGVAGGIAGARRPNQIAAAADDVVDHVAVLERHGITPYRGQVKDSAGAMRMEGTLTARASQLDDLTSAALRTAGIEGSRRATPEVLRRGQNAITTRMNQAVAGVDVPVTPNLGQRIADVVQDYYESSAGKDLPVDLRKVANELMEAATDPAGGSLTASLLKRWRTRLGSHTTSSNELTQEAAHALRSVIDDATEEALIAVGREADIAALAQARGEYRNFFALVKSVNYAGREAARGVITPERLATATKRVFGEQNYALGKGGELPELARSAVTVIGSAPTVSAGGVRDIMTQGTLTGGGAAGGAALGGLEGAAIGAAVGYGMPTVGGAAMRSNAAQTFLNHPLRTTAQGRILVPGLLAQQE